MSAPCFRRRRRAFLFLTLALLAASAGRPLPSRADIQNPPGRANRGPGGLGRPTGGRNEPTETGATRPASAARAVTTVEVPLGGSVDVPLRASGQFGKSINFLLREPPAHGTLGEMRPTGRDSAVVTYTHRVEDGPAADSFAYAVQAPGTAVSAPAVVEVRVLDDPPRPAIVSEGAGAENGALDFDFGAVPAGAGSARREVWVENRGGGVAVGILEPPAPWVVEGAAGYRLGRDERQGFTLVFRPGTARAYTGRLVVGRGGAGSSAQLLGAGLRPDGSRPPPAGTAEEETSPSPGAVATLFPPRGSAAGLPPAPGLAAARPGNTPPPSPSAPAAAPASADGSNPPSAVAVNPNSPSSGAGGNPAGGRAYAPLVANGPRREEAPVKHLVVQDRGKHTLTVTWPTPKPAPTAYRVERRRLWMENGDLQMEWDTLENVAYTTEPDGTVHAVLRGLNADEPQTVRVLALDGRGTLSEPSAQLNSATLPDPHWWQRITPLNALFAGLAGCLLLLWRRKRVYG